MSIFNFKNVVGLFVLKKFCFPLIVHFFEHLLTFKMYIHHKIKSFYQMSFGLLAIRCWDDEAFVFLDFHPFDNKVFVIQNFCYSFSRTFSRMNLKIFKQHLGNIVSFFDTFSLYYSCTFKNTQNFFQKFPNLFFI